MNITFSERPNSYKVTTNPKSTTAGYVLTGISTRSEARAYASGSTPLIAAGLWRQNIEVNEKGFQIWDIDVTYGPYAKKEPEDGDYKWSFDTTGGTKHVTQALAHAGTFDSTGSLDAYDLHHGAIGVNENGEVEGVDIPDKTFKWTESRQLLLGNYAWSYASTIKSLTGRINDSPFRGFEAESVLFEGAQGGFSAKNPLILDLTFHFSYQSPITPGSEASTLINIVDITKKGQDYLWVSYKTTTDEDYHFSVKKPTFVFVEKVFLSANFSLLGIGTAGLILPTGF